MNNAIRKWNLWNSETRYQEHNTPNRAVAYDFCLNIESDEAEISIFKWPDQLQQYTSK